MMKHLSEEAFIIAGFFVGLFVLLFLAGLSYFGTDVYSKYLDTYNTQQDRQMFLKSYEIILECRKNSTIVNMDKVCGQVPTFMDNVK